MDIVEINKSLQFNTIHPVEMDKIRMDTAGLDKLTRIPGEREIGLII